MSKFIIKHDDIKADKDYGITADRYAIKTDLYVFETITPEEPAVPPIVDGTGLTTTPGIPAVPAIIHLVASVRRSDIKAIVEDSALDPNP